MSSLSDAGHPWWFQCGSHSYHAVDVEPMSDSYELLDIVRPSMLASNAVCIQSTTGSPLEFSGSNDATINKNSFGGSWAEDQKRNYFQGWRMGFTLCAVTAGSVLMVNVVLTVIAYTKYGLSGGLGTLQEGSCRTTKDLSLWLHLAINVLSTLLLGASNYCMQCLTSPTREEVDIAHGQHIWLDIGIPSVRNLRRIAPYRIALWYLLAVSTIPLHLLWNSAVFSTLSSQDYTVFTASPFLFNVAGLNWSAPVPILYYEDNTMNENNYTLQSIQNASSWPKLDNNACIKAYGQEFVSARGDVLAITSSMNASVPIEAITNSMFIPAQPYAWICLPNTACSINSVLVNSADWTISPLSEDTYSVQYCLSKPVEERCRIQFSITIMIIVIFCNFLKTSCIFLTLWLQKSQPLVTLGDAIDSFLKTVDSTTENKCSAWNGRFSRKEWCEGPIEWQGEKRYRWFSSASTKRWVTCNVLCISTLGTASYLLYVGLYGLTDTSFSHIWQMGYGAVTSESMIWWNFSGSRGLLLTTLVANSPQFLLSFLFFTYNSLFTCMLLASEWNGYAHNRKPLRVTSATGAQRSTYRLQLPYKYGVPLLIMSGTLHWLVSQCLFLARVTYFLDGGKEDYYRSISTVGYSCIAILTVIVLGAIVVLLDILNGFRRYKPGIPLVGSCSAAISAACHRPKEDVDAASKPLVWGVVSTKDGIGNCCFTSFEVTPPIEGKLYGSLDRQS